MDHTEFSSSPALHEWALRAEKLAVILPAVGRGCASESLLCFVVTNLEIGWLHFLYISYKWLNVLPEMLAFHSAPCKAPDCWVFFFPVIHF